jgi:hypothetical protein
LAKLNTPAKNILIQYNIYMYFSQTPPPGQNVKIRRVRGLAALGVAQPGDSGSPVYALEGRRGADFVRAYGVVSGSNGDAVVAPFDWIYVKVSVSR